MKYWKWIVAIIILTVLFSLAGVSPAASFFMSLYFVVIFAVVWWFMKKVYRVENKGIKIIERVLEPHNSNNRKHTDELILVQGGSDHKIYRWSEYSIAIGTKEYMGGTPNIPFQGILVTKEDEFAIFKKFENVMKLSPNQLRNIATSMLYHGNYDLIIAWEGSLEMACGSENFIVNAYGLQHRGLVLKEENFIRIFKHDCKNLTKSRMMKFIKENVNRNEVGLLVSFPSYSVAFVKEEVAKRSFQIPRDILVFIDLINKTSYIYDIPFKVISKEELLKLANEVKNLHAEVGIIVNRENMSAGVLKSYLANTMIPNSIEDTVRSDIMFVKNENTEETVMVPIKWKIWTPEEIIRMASNINKEEK